MSERINRHEWPGGAGSRCTVCGAIRRDDSPAGTPLGCIDRVAAPQRAGGARIVACEDADAIGERLKALQEERDAARGAAPATPPGGAPAPLIDHRDCCV